LGCICGDSSSMFAACTKKVHCTTVSQPGTFFKQFDRFGFVLSTPLSHNNHPNNSGARLFSCALDLAYHIHEL
jgi:hypothetical protein